MSTAHAAPAAAGGPGLWARLEALFLGPRSRWGWIAVAVLAILPHLAIIQNPFVFDDWNNIPDNPYMSAPGGLHRMFVGNVWGFLGKVGVGNYYRPLMHLFHWTIFNFAGHEPGWFHLACLGLHCGVTLLAGLLIARLAGRREVGLVAALLFAVHPVHTEVLAWISCSPELLSSLFSLAGFYAYLWSTSLAGRRGRRVFSATLTGVLLLLACLAKEIGAMLPLAIASYEWLARRRRMREWIGIWPEFAALLVSLSAYLAVRIYALGGLVPVGRRGALPILDHLWTALALLYRYVAVTVYPIHLNFFRYYSPNRSPFQPVVIAGMATLALLAALTYWLHRRRLPECTATALFLLWLLPIFQLPYIFTGLLMIERALYLPSVGFCWLAAALIVRLGQRRGPAVAVALLALVLVVYSSVSTARVTEWADEVKLTDEGIAFAPGSFHMWMVRGEAMLRHGRPAEAVAALQQSLRLRDDYADAHNLLGRAYALADQPALALPEYTRAAALSLRDGRPDSASRAYNNLGALQRALGRDAEAMASYERALSLDPTFAAARNNLGYVLILEGRVPEAIVQLREALRQEPSLAPAYENLGLALAMTGKLDEAAAVLEQAARLNPGSAEIEARRGEVELARGNRAGARAHLARALQLQPDNARALHALSFLQSPEGPQP